MIPEKYPSNKSNIEGLKCCLVNCWVEDMKMSQYHTAMLIRLEGRCWVRAGKAIHNPMTTVVISAFNDVALEIFDVEK